MICVDSEAVVGTLPSATSQVRGRRSQLVFSLTRGGSLLDDSRRESIVMSQAACASVNATRSDHPPA